MDEHPRQQHEYPSDIESDDEPYVPTAAQLEALRRESRGDYLGSDSEIENELNYSASDESDLDDPLGRVGAEGPSDPNSEDFDFEGFRFVLPDRDPRPPLPDFRGEPVGPHPEHVADYGALTEVELFQLFVDLPLVDYICRCINAKADFATQKEAVKKNVPIHKIKWNGAKWYDVNTDQFYVFLALNFKMGITKEPKISDYWNRDPMFGGHSIFPAAMSRSRFRNIMKFLRFSLQTEPDQKFTHPDRVDHVLQLLNDNCQKYLHPGQHLSIDECLVLWKGRLCFRQYIKLKRSRFGIKYFFLCPGDPAWQGYSWRFRIYYGRNSDFTVDEMTVTRQDAERVGKSGRVVLHLMSGLFGKNRHCVTDNWYTSQILGKVLYAHQTYLTGTIKASRGIPKVLRDENVPQDSSVFMRRGEELVIKFQDRSLVHCYTTQYNAVMVPSLTYRRGIVGPVHRQKPAAIHHYNTNMGGVDKCDQLLQPYLANRKSLAWFKKLLLHMFQRMVLNAYIIWKNTGMHRNRHTEFLQFKKEVIKQLLMKYSPGVSDLMTLHHQQFPPRQPRELTRESRQVRLNRLAIEHARRPRRQAPRDRSAPRDLPSDLESDSDSDNYPAPDTNRIRIPESHTPASSAALVVPDQSDLAAAGSSHQPHVPSVAALVVPDLSVLVAAGSSRQPHPSVADVIGLQPVPPHAVPVSVPDSPEST